MPIVDGLEGEFDGQVAVIRLDAIEADNAALQKEYNLFGHPAFALVDSNGEVASTYFGPQTAETLRQAMDALPAD